MSWRLDVRAAPPKWPRTTLRSILTRSRERGRPDLPLLSVNLPEGVVRRKSEDSRPAPGEDLSAYQVVRRGDLVMNQLGKPHGALGVSEHDGIISPAYFVARITGSVDRRFVHHLLRTRLYISEYERRGKFMPPSQFDISWEQFRSIPVALPPLAEQRAIANFLDAETAGINALIAKKRRMVDVLEERFRAERTAQVLRRLDPVHGASAGTLPYLWTNAALGVLVMLHRGFDLPLESREVGSVPIVSSGGVSGTHSVPMCQPPGVVTGRYGTVGEVFFVDQPYWPLNTTLYVSDFRGNDPRWVFHLLAALPLEYDAEKSAVTGINRNVVGGLRVPVPPLDEQRQIAATLDAKGARTDHLAECLRRQVRLLQEHRQALITAAVTGEVDIPGVAA